MHLRWIMYAFVLSVQVLISPHAAQVKRQFGLVISTDASLRPVRVTAFGTNDHGSITYRVAFADGTSSDPLLYSNLDGLAKLICDQSCDQQRTPTRRRNKGFCHYYHTRKEKERVANYRQRKAQTLPAFSSAESAR